jgi:T5SS/PEP-CTERM-associated repeat protein
MKRALVLSLYFLVGFTPDPEASPAVCEGEYSGSYTGDFSGEATGFFSLGGPANPGFCNSTPAGQFIVVFHGALAQFYFGSPNSTSVPVNCCVLGDFSFHDFASSIEIDGMLDLGSCTANGTWSYELGFDEFGNPAVHSGQFSISLTPPVREGIFWGVLNGDFNTPSNWSPQELPGPDRNAVFNQNTTYAVSFGSPASSGGFIIEHGNVTFLTGSYQATGGSVTEPSAIIGNTNNSAILNLASHNLTTAFSTLGTGPETGGAVGVESGSTWTEQGRMIVGQGGAAFLLINDEATVTSLETQIGAEASGDGTVNVSEDTSFIGDETEWTAGSLAVGLAGKGTVNHFSGSMRSNAAVIGVEANSSGSVTLGSPNNSATWFLNGGLTVGDRGQGELMIVEGGYLFVNASIQLVVGRSQGGVGTVSVDGASTEIFAPGSFIIVGADGTGTVNVTNGGTVIGSFDSVGPKGTVRIDNAKWDTKDFIIRNMGKVTLNNGTIEADDTFNLNFGGRLEGTGYVDTPEATLDGTIAPGVQVDAPKGPQQASAIGTLTFGGNVDFGSATLEIEVGGLAEGSYDVIHATGAVNLQNATVVFSFVDGFLPQTGDTVPYLMADAGVTIDNLAMEFEGVAEGFQFEVREENGMLVFEALNDAQPEPVPSADLDGDGDIDSIDLLIFIEQLNGQ